MRINLGNIYFTDFHHTGCRIPKTWNQAGCRCLSAARRTHQSHGLTWLCCEGHMRESRAFRSVISKTHILKFYFITTRGLRVTGCFQGRCLHHLIDTSQSGTGQHNAGGSKHYFCKRSRNDGWKYGIKNEIRNKSSKTAVCQCAWSKEQRHWNQKHKSSFGKS